MGHQIAFHATPDDIDEIEAALAELHPFVVVHSRSLENRARVVSSVNTDSGWLFYFLARAEDLDRIVMDQVATQGHWAVDVLQSPVVEFSACFLDDRVLRSGRAYYVDGYYDADGAWVEKSPEFRAWAKRVLSTLKKRLVKHGRNYVGAGALRWLDATNGRLE